MLVRNNDLLKYFYQLYAGGARNDEEKKFLFFNCNNSILSDFIFECNDN